MAPIKSIRVAVASCKHGNGSLSTCSAGRRVKSHSTIRIFSRRARIPKWQKLITEFFMPLRMAKADGGLNSQKPVNSIVQSSGVLENSTITDEIIAYERSIALQMNWDNWSDIEDDQTVSTSKGKGKGKKTINNYVVDAASTDHPSTSKGKGKGKKTINNYVVDAASIDHPSTSKKKGKGKKTINNYVKAAASTSDLSAPIYPILDEIDLKNKEKQLLLVVVILLLLLILY